MRAQKALQRHGIAAQRSDRSCQNTHGEGNVVSDLEADVADDLVLCSVYKYISPRVDPNVIFEGPNWSGKAHDLRVANLDCSVYAADERTIVAVRAAMRDLGGRRRGNL
jgi:hypothetical protein